ncbi:MAG: hypothetical protein KDB71_08970 [Mycobacterium sp.]|nr:hypothetical protein [Mycobacterium sp.]
MNGSQSLIRSLLAAGVDICPMNPGTSEMHFVSALDDVPEMRGVVGLFEGGATGAADGYARIAGEPAAVPGRRAVSTADGLADALRRAYLEPGPHLIEAMIAPIR